jgi:hypothetical protein
MDAPHAQGVCGFVGKIGNFELSDVTILADNEYAVVNVVSLDEKELNKSLEILIQVGTVSQPTNWEESPATFELRGKTVSGYKIENTGKMPWKCANTELSVSIKNSIVDKAFLLDAAGYSKKELKINKKNKEVFLELPQNSMYVVLVK